MPNTTKYKLTAKDFILGAVFLALLGLQIYLYVSANGVTSVDELFAPVALTVFGFMGLEDVLYYHNVDFLVFDYFLRKKEEKRRKTLAEYMDAMVHRQLDQYLKKTVDQAVQESLSGIMTESMEHIVEESIDTVIYKSSEAYFKNEISLIKNYTNQRIDHVLSQLKINTSQFNELRLELIKMRSLPLRTLKDAEDKIKEFVKSGDVRFNEFSRNSAVVDLRKIDSAKRTYNDVDYFLNFHDAMYSDNHFRDFVRVMYFLITEKIGVDAFDTIVIPHDSNVILGVEVAKLFGKPVVKMRAERGKIELDHLWDGEFSDGARVLIVHDVLVSGGQILHAQENIPERCEVVALCCLVARTDGTGLSTMETKNVRVERIIDLSDSEIEQLLELKS